MRYLRGHLKDMLRVQFITKTRYGQSSSSSSSSQHVSQSINNYLMSSRVRLSSGFDSLLVVCWRCCKCYLLRGFYYFFLLPLLAPSEETSSVICKYFHLICATFFFFFSSDHIKTADKFAFNQFVVFPIKEWNC